MKGNTINNRKMGILFFHPCPLSFVLLFTKAKFVKMSGLIEFVRWRGSAMCRAHAMKMYGYLRMARNIERGLIIMRCLAH